MKGIVFTEFLSMVEEKFGYETVDKIIIESNLPNDGAYSSVGTYKHEELVRMITALNKDSGIPIPDLIKTFGKYFFNVLRSNYGVFFKRVPNLFAFLQSIHEHIHVEVEKLYPDAELPAFEVIEVTESRMVMIYTSKRKMSDFAEGLIENSADYFNEKVMITKTAIKADGTEVKFEITKV